MLRVEVAEAGAVAVRVDPEAVMLLIMYLCLTLLPTRQCGAFNHRHHHENLQEVARDHHHHHHDHHPDLNLIINLSLRGVLNAMMS